jgi:hypothetical protein
MTDHGTCVVVCRIDKAQQDLGSNHRDTVGSAVGGDYRRVSGQSGLPAAAAAAQRSARCFTATCWIPQSSQKT